MRCWKRPVWFVCAVAVIAGCGAAPPLARQPAQQQEQDTELCPQGKSPLVAVANRPPRGVFVIHETGRVEQPKEGYDVAEFAFAFPDAKSGDQVRVEADDDILACGPLGAGPNGTRVWYVLPNKPDRGSTLVVRVFRGHAAPVAAEKAKAEAALVEKLAETERDELHRTVSGLVDAEQALRDLVREANATTLTAAGGKVKSAISALETGIDCERATWEANPLAEPRCAERRKLVQTLDAIALALQRATTAQATTPIATSLVESKLATLVEELAKKPALTVVEQDAYCKTVAQLRWVVGDPGKPGLLSRSQIPYVGSDELVVVQYGETRDVPAAPTRDRLALLVLDAPVATPGSFAKRQGNVVSTDISALISLAVPTVLRAVPSSVVKLGFDKSNFAVAENFTAPNKVDIAKLPATFSRVCSSESATKPAPDVPIKLPEYAYYPDLNPKARRESRVFVFGPIGNKFATEVTACEGAACTASADDKNVRTRVAIVPSQRGRFTLLAELAAGVSFATVGQVAPGSQTYGFKPQTTPTFQPVFGAAGPDQEFQLAQNVDPRNAFTTLLLLGVRATDR